MKHGKKGGDGSSLHTLPSVGMDPIILGLYYPLLSLPALPTNYRTELTESLQVSLAILLPVDARLAF